jgi:hypothetical protein
MLKRDPVIASVATLVGPQHKVDLKNYDLLILIEIYKVRYTLDQRQKVKHTGYLTQV